MPRIHRLAVLTLLALLVAPLTAQELPAGSPGAQTDRARLEARLKRAVDRALARELRRLRSELHGAIEQALDAPEADLEALLAELEGGVSAAADRPRFAPRPAPTEAASGAGGRAALAALETRLEALRAAHGPDHPDVRALAGRIATLHDAAERPWSGLGLELGAVADGLGATVLGVRPGSPAAAAGVPVGAVIRRAANTTLTGGPSDRAGRIAARIAAYRIEGGTEVLLKGQDPEGRPAVWRLEGARPSIEEIDPAALIDEMSRRALESTLGPETESGPRVVRPEEPEDPSGSIEPSGS